MGSCDGEETQGLLPAEDFGSNFSRYFLRGKLRTSRAQRFIISKIIDHIDSPKTFYEHLPT